MKIIKLVSIVILLASLSLGCKVKLNSSSSVSSGAVTWVVTENGAFVSFASFLGKDTRVEIKTENYVLTVNNQLYGKMQKGDEIKVEGNKVFRNGVEIFPEQE